MPGRRTLVIAGVGAAMAASVLVGAYAVWNSADEPRGTPPAKIKAEARFSPSVALFGDTVTAHVDVVLDKARVDPDSVRIVADFAPFEVIGRQQRLRRDAERSAYVRVSLVLRCLSGTCVPSGQSARYEFEPARISFAAPEPDGIKSSIDLRLPSLRIYSRFTALGAGSAQGETSQPWRADLSSLPPVSYLVAPGVLIVLLLAGTALALIAALFLGYRAWPRRVPAVEPEPEPEPPPDPLSPLEQALVLLEQSIRVDGAADQRRALELVAEELELAEWGDPDLARTARGLAWSRDVPPVAETAGLAARVRASVPEPVEIDAGEVHA
jgi:hypothetical protein